MSTEQLLAKSAGWEGEPRAPLRRKCPRPGEVGVSGHGGGRAGAADLVPLWAGAAASAHLHLEVQMSSWEPVLHFTEVGVQAQSGVCDFVPGTQ